MSLDISKCKTTSTKDFGRVEDGTYPARLVQVIDFGVQPMEDYTTGEAKDPKPRAFLTFEFPTEMIEIQGEEKPRWLGKEYTISNHELSGLLKVVKALDPTGNETDLTKLLGDPCMVQVGTTSGGKAKLTNVSPLPKGLPVGDLVNDPVSFDLSEPNKLTFDGFPDWIKEKITSGLEYEGSDAQGILENADVSGGAY